MESDLDNKIKSNKEINKENQKLKATEMNYLKQINDFENNEKYYSSKIKEYEENIKKKERAINNLEKENKDLLKKNKDLEKENSEIKIKLDNEIRN